MPDIQVGIVRQAAPTSTGTQDFDDATALGGATPKAALFFITRGTSDGTPADHAVLAAGFCDGTKQFCQSAYTQHGVGTTNTGNRSFSDEVVAILDPTADNGGTVDGEANFDSFHANGVRINWADNAPAAGYLVTCVLFAGDDLSVDCDNVDTGDTLDLETNVEAPGFEPELMFGIAAHFNDTGASSGFLSFGAAYNDGADPATMRSTTWSASDAKTQERVFTTLKTDGVASNGPATTSASFEITNFDSLGFSIITRNDGGNNVDLAYLALKFGGAKSIVSALNAPTSTGSFAVTGTGFKPQFALMGLTSVATEDSQEADDDAGPLGFSVFNAAESFSNQMTADDNAGTTDNESESTDAAASLNDASGSALFDGTFTSFDSDGFTLSFPTNVDSTQRRWWYMAIEESAGGAFTLAVDSGSYAITGTAATLKADRKLSAGSGSYAITGTAAGLAAGYKLSAESGTFVISGTDATLTADRKLPADSGSYNISGTAANLAVGFNFVVDSGSYTITGTAAGLAVGRKVTASSGSYVISGTAATLKADRQLAAASGTYTITGTAAGLAVGYKLAAASGTYVITGTAATLIHGTPNPVMDAASGTFVITGTGAGLAAGRKLAAGSGSYAINGTAATLRATRQLPAESGSYAINGTAANLTAARRLSAGSGSYFLSGTAARLAASRRLAANPGSFLITGTDAELTVGGREPSVIVNLSGRATNIDLRERATNEILSGRATNIGL